MLENNLMLMLSNIHKIIAIAMNIIIFREAYRRLGALEYNFTMIHAA